MLRLAILRRIMRGLTMAHVGRAAIHRLCIMTRRFGLPLVAFLMDVLVCVLGRGLVFALTLGPVFASMLG